MENLHIETSHNVIIDQKKAKATTRIGSYIIDMLIITAYFVIILIISSTIDKSFDLFGSGNFTYLVLIFIPTAFYSLLFEIFNNGQSLGKMATNIKVVRLDGKSATLKNYLLRWVFRIIDISLCSGSIALFFILFSKKGQRLGDFAANTTVISISPKKEISIQRFISFYSKKLSTYLFSSNFTFGSRYRSH